jgi:hypothetical protein
LDWQALQRQQAAQLAATTNATQRARLKRQHTQRNVCIKSVYESLARSGLALSGDQLNLSNRVDSKASSEFLAWLCSSLDTVNDAALANAANISESAASVWKNDVRAHFKVRSSGSACAAIAWAGLFT